MKYLKLYENFTNQTPLERQFSEVVVAGLTNNYTKFSLKT